MLACASARFHVARERVIMTVARHTTGKGTTERRLSTVAERTVFAALAIVTLRTGRARFDVANGEESNRRGRMAKGDLAEEAHSVVNTECGVDTDRCDVRKQTHEFEEGQRW